MRIIRFDSLGGASGDMVLGSLLDLGAGRDALESCLRSLPVEDFRISAEAVVERGMRATRATVDVPDAPHPHRRLGDILALIGSADMPEKVKSLASAVFTRLAEAEAAVHGTTLDAVHFHEVGAMDAIVDVVGSCFCLANLRVDAVTVPHLPVGRGTVKGAHGVMPLPVPAVAELLRGHAVEQTDEPFELVTPTGAAILTTWRDRLPAPAPLPPMPITGIGVGAGHRALKSRPNVLRATLMDDSAPGLAGSNETCYVLECNLDDSNPQWIAALMDRLMQGPALDAYAAPVQMKKQRPGVVLTVLCEPDRREDCKRLIFEETTTFGIREMPARRTVLARRHETVQTPYGPVRMKVGSLDGKDVTRSPEYEDCLALARSNGVAVRLVHEAAMRA